MCSLIRKAGGESLVFQMKKGITVCDTVYYLWGSDLTWQVLLKQRQLAFPFASERAQQHLATNIKTQQM